MHAGRMALTGPTSGCRKAALGASRRASGCNPFDYEILALAGVFCSPLAGAGRNYSRHQDNGPLDNPQSRKLGDRGLSMEILGRVCVIPK